MTKHLFAVFAHPDDEAFGPCGTLLMETDAGTQLHLVLLTAGEHGSNFDGHSDLGAVRLEEWKRSGELLGAASQTHLGYVDSLLSNTVMPEITERIIEVVRDKATGADEIELISFEFGGITGHIDHIVAARAAAQAFCQLKQADDRVARLRLFCLPHRIRPERDTSWLYAEAGCDDEQVDEVIDARHLRERIETVMAAHASQASDARYVKKLLGPELGRNWFQIIE